MKKKKDANSLRFSNDNIFGEKTEKKNDQGFMTLNSTKYSLTSSVKKSKNISVEEDAENIKHKRFKQKKRKESEYMKSNELPVSHDNYNCGEEKPSSPKKRKKEINMESKSYKPGMLSDLLQKNKYGYLVLPWETSFGKDQIPDRLDSEGDGGVQKPKLKVNPLFDMSKRNNGSVVSKNSTTYSVFVGNLPRDITVNQVKKIFKKFGKYISKIKIRSKEREKHKMCPINKQNVSMNNEYKHALVKFSSLDSYAAALKMNGKLYNGHHLRITEAKGEISSDPDKSVFVGNLAVGTSDDVLWKTFERCGDIDSVRIIRDKLNKKGYFGYVNFKFSKSVDEALQLDGTSVLDRDIRVNRIKSNIDSLSNSISVKRKKMKRIKPKLNEIESSNMGSTFGGNQEEAVQTLEVKTIKNMEQQIEPGIPKKKKKKRNFVVKLKRSKLLKLNSLMLSNLII